MAAESPKGQLGSVPACTARPLYPRYCCKSLFGGRTKFFSAADAFYERRYEGPHRFTQKRPRSFVWALRSTAAAEQISFCGIFGVVQFSTFATQSGAKQTSRRKAATSVGRRSSTESGRVLVSRHRNAIAEFLPDGQ